ncbi:hypothetical protein NV379_02650 [Paenibacillus sp. N1-5-1-14]|uniref:hypothetical protein n=1 Tax=Paenibacillus radicibacter TaxID=2972488 RepID=UPI0021590029|nr:hypothetical protein [Paenibacillus radicibacter]MCR8641546.1 hypothetical protein [Paenibacillus radicibacter]
MSKQLTLSTVSKLHAKEFNEQKKVTLKTGDFIMIQTKFRKTNVQNMLVEYQEILESMKNMNVDFGVIKDISFVYYMLLLRHFTNLNNIPKDINKMVSVCEKLIDLDILEEIFESFELEELKKIDEMIKKISNNSNLIGKQMGEIFTKAVINESVKDDEDGLQQSE